MKKSTGSFNRVGFGQNVFVRIDDIDLLNSSQKPLIKVRGSSVNRCGQGKKCASSHLPQA